MTTRNIDWEAIHRRVAEAGSAIAAVQRRAPQEVRRILQERARAAARPPPAPDQAERLELLAFTLAGETYAVETVHVREVCPVRDLTAIPCTPAFLAGVVNLRGRILAVVDLGRFFELPARGLTPLNRVVVLGDGAHELGLLVDSIEEIGSVVVSELREGLPTLTGIREKFLLGVTRQLVAVLDGRRLLEDGGLRADSDVTKAGS